MAKDPSPLLGYNNNIRHKNRVFHIQTEDSGVRHPHVITHLFMDGGRILKSVKTSYAEHVGTEKMADLVRKMMKDQHKGMLIALRDGQFDVVIEGGEAPKPAPREASPSKEIPKAASLPEATANAPVEPHRKTAPAPAAPPQEPRAIAASALPSSVASERDLGSESAPRVPERTRTQMPGPRSNPAPPPEPRAPELRSPELRSPELRSPELRSPEPRSPELRSPELRAQELRPSQVSLPAFDPPLDLTPPPANLFRPRTGGNYSELGDQSEPPPPSRGAPQAPSRPQTRPPLGRPASLPPGALVGKSTGLKPATLPVSSRSALVTGRTESARLEGVRPPGSPSSARSPSTIRRTSSPPPPTVETDARVPRDRPSAPRPGVPVTTTRVPESRYASARPASIFGHSKPRGGSSIFGEDIISDKSLDEVIMSYLADDGGSPDSSVKDSSDPKRRK